MNFLCFFYCFITKTCNVNVNQTNMHKYSAKRV